MGTNTVIDTKHFTDKASKEKRYLDLYNDNDYIKAYSTHTDIRVHENPLWSIGRGDEWESHGELQLKFLKNHGLTPESKLLDVGCGIGRLARKVVPFLNESHYTGIDISQKALDYAIKLSEKERWSHKKPIFKLSDGMSIPVEGKFNIVWAHSVFTHLPEELIRSMMISVKSVLEKDGKFLFTYKKWRKSERTGLKQFRYPFEFFKDLANEISMEANEIDIVFPATQHTAKVLWGNTGIIQ